MSHDSKQQRILIVDDMPLNVKLLGEALREHYMIYIATNGEDALSIATGSDAPDLILLDVEMPQMDGYEVCKRLKNNEKTKNIPVIFVTAKTETDDELQGFALGAVDYISKPINIQIAQARIKAHLDLKKVIAERESLFDDLLQSQKMAGIAVLSGGIAHDFNNILAVITGNAELALSKIPPETLEINMHLEHIVTASARAADLCTQLLAYSGQGRYIVDTMNINHVIEERHHLLQHDLSKYATLTYALEEKIPTIHADSSQMQQVLMNLIRNASESFDIKGKSGDIHVSTEGVEMDTARLKQCLYDQYPTPGKYVCLKVQDHGCGMDEQTRIQIFDPFFTTKFTGRGLGMSAIYGIVCAHHGAIRVHSTVGEGTTVEIFLPAQDAEINPVAETNISTPTETPRKENLTVLLVDDEHDLRESATMMLEHINYHVLTAKDGETALSTFEKQHQKIDVILLDITMPGMDGITCAAHLLQVNPTAKIVLSSGYSEQEMMERAKYLSIQGFLPKPYTMKLLKEALE